MTGFAALCAACTTIPSFSPNGLRSDAITSINLPLAKTLPVGKSEKYYDPNQAGVPIYDTHSAARQRLGAYFFISDFSRTGDSRFRFARIDTSLATCLNRLRAALNTPMHVNSSYRTWEYNQQLISEGKKASKKSFHLSGQAVDVMVRNVSTSQFAKTLYAQCGCRVGLGVAHRWFHVDTRGYKVRPWGYGGTSTLQLRTARSIQNNLCEGGRDDLNEVGVWMDMAGKMINKSATSIKRWFDKLKR